MYLIHLKFVWIINSKFSKDSCRLYKRNKTASKDPCIFEQNPVSLISQWLESSGEEEGTLQKEITKSTFNVHRLYPETYLSVDIKYTEMSMW